LQLLLASLSAFLHLQIQPSARPGQRPVSALSLPLDEH
jgi:hypothetical protein